MAEAALVREIWSQVEELRSVLQEADAGWVAEALLVAASGEWEIVVLHPRLETEGSLDLYTRLDELASRAQADVALLSHITLLDASSAEAAELLDAPVESRTPPLHLRPGLFPSKPEMAGTVLWRDLRWARVAGHERLRVEVSAGLGQLELESAHQWAIDSPESMKLRADLVVFDAGRVVAALELTASGDDKNRLNRLVGIAGRANLSGLPHLWVYSPSGSQGQLAEVYGRVPVVPVDWDAEGVGGLERGLRMVRGSLPTGADTEE